MLRRLNVPCAGFRQVSGNTFVFSPGTCELWNCSSKEDLERATEKWHAQIVAENVKMGVNSAISVDSRMSQVSVFSQLCNYQESLIAKSIRRNPVFVKLWEWNYVDIAKECQEFLGPNGFEAVQVSPVTEHILGPQWWTKYQPVSFSLNSRSGSMEDFSAMVRDCRASGVQVIVDLIINHIAAPCKESKNLEGAKAESEKQDLQVFLTKDPKKHPIGKNLTPCVGWNGSLFGNRRLAGARGWDKAGPEFFHHQDSLMENCFVGPPGWSCGGGGNDVTDCSCLAGFLQLEGNFKDG